VRIAHATDIHWFAPPGLRDATIKRAMGTANLYLMNRRAHFDTTVQQALVDHLVGLAPDLVIVTGDLTAQALDREFAIARRALQPVIDAQPFFVVPGNHDVYTSGAQRNDRIAQHFGDVLHREGAIGRLDVGRVTVLGLDPNRPTYLVASGRVPDDQLTALGQTLADPALADRFVILALHYPIVDRRDVIYDGNKHGLLNARALLRVLEAAPKRPDMVIHGHRHHGYRATLPVGDIPSFNCGSSGYAWQPEQGRAAAMNLYTVRDGALSKVERFRYDGSTFAPEEGGAYATGG
jgi:3',5'-cyclic AMP phosphodiesterase CpdA